jgi:hypothetical protein
MFKTPEKTNVAKRARPKARPIKTAVKVDNTSNKKTRTPVNQSISFFVTIREMITISNPNRATNVAC